MPKSIGLMIVGANPSLNADGPQAQLRRRSGLPASLFR